MSMVTTWGSETYRRNQFAVCTFQVIVKFSGLKCPSCFSKFPLLSMKCVVLTSSLVSHYIASRDVKIVLGSDFSDVTNRIVVTIELLLFEAAGAEILTNVLDSRKKIGAIDRK